MKKMLRKIRLTACTILKFQKEAFKKIILPVFLFTIFFTAGTNIFAQDSSHLRISLLTCGPGAPDDELYTTFGHTGVRVTDSSSVTDYVYNYGNFDAFEDNFYLNFVKGRLRYYVEAANFNDFADSYKASNRSITEQVLNLTAAEKIHIQHYLNNNILPQNRHYMYEFCFDNCTTRVRDLIKKNHDSTFVQTAVMPLGSTFRQAIHFCINRNDQQWSKLGIDLLLGKPCDAIMTTEQMGFLPENLMLTLNQTKHPFVLSVNNIVNADKKDYSNSFFTPMVVFSILFILVVLISFSGNKKVATFLNGFDGLLFFFTGAMGVLFVFMWTCTDHSMVKNNFNLVWAWPTHIVIAFFINSKKDWVKKYWAITILGMIIVLISWFFLPQQMNNALLPIVFLLLYRSMRRYQAF